MAEQKKEPKRCGAKNRSGKPCQKWAMPNGRCANHGGKSTGPPKGSRNAWKHGIYSSALSDEEKKLYGEVQLGDVDHELRIARIQLKRALDEQKKILDNPNDPKDLTGFELFEIKKSKEDPQQDEKDKDQKQKTKREVTSRRPDFRAVIDRLLMRIAKLETTRIELTGAASSGTPEEAATRIRLAVLEMVGTIPKTPKRDDDDEDEDGDS